MITAPTANPRLTLAIDVTDLNDEQRRKFTEAVTNLLDDFVDYEADEPMIAGWTATTLEEALTRLDRENGWVQARTIRQALKNRGVVTRAQVYKIGKYDKDRMLRGFTRPANRIVAQMRAAGEIPASAVDLLEPMYNNGVQADGFRVPAELANLVTD